MGMDRPSLSAKYINALKQEGQRAEERGERGGTRRLKKRDAIAEPPLMPRAAHPFPTSSYSEETQAA